MVTRSALQNAASIGKNILTTEAIVAEPPERDGAGGMPGGMPDMATVYAGGLSADVPRGRGESRAPRRSGTDFWLAAGPRA